jgi:hypothetical protein
MGLRFFHISAAVFAWRIYGIWSSPTFGIKSIYIAAWRKEARKGTAE